MKTNIKARITCLFISKTTIMVIIFPTNSYRLSLFLNFIPFLLFISSFFPYLFRFNFVVSEQNVHIPFCRPIWAELSFLFWTFLSGTFFQAGGCTCTQCTPPPAYAPGLRLLKKLIIQYNCFTCTLCNKLYIRESGR